MCLYSVDFKLQWDADEDDFIGYGYKAYPVSIFDSLGRICSKKHRGVKLSKSYWMEAEGRNCDLSLTIKSSSGKDYFPGFHIFPSFYMAEEYAKGYWGDFSSGYKIAQVKFKNIVGYGTNTTGNSGIYKCFIARYMKIVQLF